MCENSVTQLTDFPFCPLKAMICLRHFLYLTQVVFYNCSFFITEKIKISLLLLRTPCCKEQFSSGHSSIISQAESEKETQIGCFLTRRAFMSSSLHPKPSSWQATRQTSIPMTQVGLSSWAIKKHSGALTRGRYCISALGNFVTATTLAGVQAGKKWGLRH